MSDAYIGNPYSGLVSPNFVKEDFIGNGSLTEFNFWDCLAWQDLNADEVEHEVCAFIRWLPCIFNYF